MKKKQNENKKISLKELLSQEKPLLSFKYDVTRTKVFNPKSFEFILSCIVLASCLYFLSMAIVGLVSYKTNYRKIRNKIKQSRSLK